MTPPAARTTREMLAMDREDLRALYAVTTDFVNAGPPTGDAAVHNRVHSRLPGHGRAHCLVRAVTRSSVPGRRRDSGTPGGVS
jgi:hypothetical protein